MAHGVRKFLCIALALLLLLGAAPLESRQLALASEQTAVENPAPPVEPAAEAVEAAAEVSVAPAAEAPIAPAAEASVPEAEPSDAAPDAGGEETPNPDTEVSGDVNAETTSSIAPPSADETSGGEPSENPPSENQPTESAPIDAETERPDGTGEPVEAMPAPSASAESDAPTEGAPIEEVSALPALQPNTYAHISACTARAGSGSDASALAVLSDGIVYVAECAPESSAKICFASDGRAYTAWVDATSLTALTADELAALRLPEGAPTSGGHALPNLAANFQLTLTIDACPALVPGATHNLTASYSDGGAYAVNWSSSDPSVIEITPDGALTAISAGSATITAAGICAPASITVAVASPVPESISLNLNAITIGQGETVADTLVCSVSPAGYAGALTWASSNTRYVKVDKDTGAIRGMRTGSATITVTTENGLRASCKVDVKRAPRSVKLTADSTTLGVGGTTALHVSFNSKAHCHNVQYAISDANVVRIDGQAITALSAGTAKITAKTFNGRTASMNITVVPAPEFVRFDVEAPVLGAGQTYALSAHVNEGSAGAITFAGDNPAVATVSPDGKVVAIAEGKVNVTATAYNGVSAAQILTVMPAPTRIDLSATNVTLCVGEKVDEPVKVSLDNGMVGGLTFKSSSTRYAKVDKDTGRVSATRAGSVYITITAYNGVSAKYNVKIVKAPSKISLSGQTLLGVGDSAKLTVKPNARAGVGHYNLTSDNPAIIAVAPDGQTITALSAGTAKITAKTFNGRTASMNITVVPAPESVRFDVEAPVLGAGQTYALSAHVNEGSAGAITFAGDNPAVATVSPDGKVVAIAEGKVNVTATAYNGVSATQTLTVMPAPTRIDLSATSVTLCVGEKVDEPVKVSLDNGMVGGLTFKSSSTRYAKVDKDTGRVSATRAGSVYITITAYNGVSAKYNVKIVKAPSKISLSGQTLLGVGDSAKLTVKPNARAGVGHYNLTSDNPAIIAVAPDGQTITALSAGTAKITAKTFNGRTASMNITVVPAPESVRFDVEAPVLGAGQTYALSAHVNDGSAGAITFAGDNPAVATVSPDGKVVAVAEGKVNVTATAYNGVSAAQILTVMPAPTSMEIIETPIYIGLGEVLPDALQVRFNEGSAGGVSFKSSSTRYVKVSAAGVLTGARVGNATITATSHNGLTAKCRVIVQKAPTKVAISAPMSTFSVGQTQVVSVSVAGRGHWTLTSSDPNIVAIEGDGMLRAVREGTAAITVKTYNGKTAKTILTVVPAPVEVYPSAAKASVGEGQCAKLSFAVNEGSFTNFKYAVADPEIAQVDADGTVTGLRRGQTQVIATTHNGLTASMDLEVLPAPDAIRFESDPLTIGLGELRPLHFIAEPEGAVGTYNYASSDARIVSVRADGTLAGMAVGSAQITVTAQNGTFATLSVTVVPYSDANPVFCMAHRGASGYRPDNSLAAFRYAAELGADMVELDVRKTLDGQIVVFHDSTISYNGKKYAISSMTMDAIRRADPNVCSLEEALECIAESNMEVMIEFKVAGIEAEVLEHVDKCSLQDRAKYGSFALSVIDKIKDLRPSAETIYIMNNKNTLKEVLKNPGKYSASIISVSSSILDATAIYKLHLAGKAVVAWTINTRSEIARFTAMGVDGITTNFPDYI